MKLFCKINSQLFSSFFKVRKSYGWGFFYFVILIITAYHFDLMLMIKNRENKSLIPLIFYIIILGVITVISYQSFLRFVKDTECIKTEAENVGLSDKEEELLNKWTNKIMHRYTPIPAVFMSLCITHVFIKYTQLNLSEVSGLSLFAHVLVFFAALSTILACFSLICNIIAIQTVYSGTFKNYVFFYPVSTMIFRKYTEIISHGLIRFWLVGGCVFFLTFIVVTRRGFIFTIIAILVFGGFLLFTYFPFYITKKKILELKLQTISLLVNAENAMDDQLIHGKEAIIKIVQESPSQISTNYYTICWSTILALIPAFISMRELLFVSTILI